MVGPRPRFSQVLAAALVLAAGHAAPARADDGVAATADAAAPADSAVEPAVEADAGFGAGASAGAPMSAIDGVVRVQAGAVDLAVGARLRLIGDRFATEDWDEVGDWLAMVRRFTWRGVEERLDGAAPWRGELAVGPLVAARLAHGTAIDGFLGGALADRRASGAHARLARGATSIEVLTGDLGRATLLAIAGGADAGPVEVGGQLALDPRAPVHAGGDAAMPGALDTTPLVALHAAAARRGRLGAARGALVVDAAWQPTLGAGLAIVAHGQLPAGRRAVVHARAELGAGTSGYIPAPFGPLYLRDREVAGAAPAGGMAPAPTLVDRARAGDLGGVGGAGAITLDADGLGAGTVGARWRPGLGAELLARAALPALRGAQAAAVVAWAPGERDALVLGAEARAWVGRRLWSAVEAARQYGGGDDPGLHAERAVWQVSAWFGVAM